MTSVREHTDALITVLEGAGLTVGRAEAPPGTNSHVVVYEITGGGVNGTLQNPDEDAILVYQVTCTGTSSEQAMWLADKARDALVGQRTIAVAGRDVPRVWVDANPGVQRDDDVSPPRFWATPRFRVFSTPA